jgi:FimV-like protein
MRYLLLCFVFFVTVGFAQTSVQQQVAPTQASTIPPLLQKISTLSVKNDQLTTAVSSLQKQVSNLTQQLQSLSLKNFLLQQKDESRSSELAASQQNLSANQQQQAVQLKNIPNVFSVLVDASNRLITCIHDECFLNMSLDVSPYDQSAQLQNEVNQWLYMGYFTPLGIIIFIFVLLIIVLILGYSYNFSRSKKERKVDSTLEKTMQGVSGEDVNASQLDLARAYIDMSDNESAKSALLNVINSGSAEQRKEAKELLKKIK